MPARKLTEKRLVVASHNPGKVREIGELLASRGLTVVSAGELGLPEPEETGDSFVANAELKALAAARASGLPALADDSGFCLAALGGDPGSIRRAGPVRTRISASPWRRSGRRCRRPARATDGRGSSPP